MSDWRESTICCKCRHWMRWSSSSLLRQMAEVCVGSDTEVLLGIWVKITLFSSSRKTSIRSSPQPVPSLIEKLGGNMKEFKLEFLHVKRNRDIKMARCLGSDHPSLSKPKTKLFIAWYTSTRGVYLKSDWPPGQSIFFRTKESPLKWNLVFSMSTAISCWKHQFSSDHWS